MRSRYILSVVLACHFLAAFTVLGVPLFIPHLLADFSIASNSLVVGLIFSLPTIMTALTAPLWGKFSDQFGRKNSLLRALIGLTIGFVIAGCASSISVFIFALVVQGVFGGTLAAANGYLATYYQKEALAKVLNWTQFTARLAMVVAPVGLGVVFEFYSSRPLNLYLWLAVLPLAGLLLALSLPKDEQHNQTPAQIERSTSPQQYQTSLPISWLSLIQFLFNFSMVVTFPYFLPYASKWVNQTFLVGFLYSMPHLVYLIMLPILNQYSYDHRHLIWGLLFLISASLWQAVLTNSISLTLARVLFGVGIFLAYCGLNQMISHAIKRKKAGFLFGKLDSVGKWAGVLAGIAAGCAVSNYNYASTFIASALTSCLTLLIVSTLLLNRRT